MLALEVLLNSKEQLGIIHLQMRMLFLQITQLINDRDINSVTTGRIVI